MTLFVSQSPGGPQLLFDTRPDFVANLEGITSHVIRAAAQAGSPSSMTFAIYGKWGAGKSTSLRYLEKSIKEKAAKAVLEVDICQVDAPLWERLSDARAALAYEVVQAVSNKAFDIVTTILERVYGRSTTAMPEEMGVKQLIDFLDIFKDAPASPMLERWLRDQVIRICRPSGSDDAPPQVSQRTLVVLIDDLDRCDRPFTADMLKATSYWQAIEQLSIFFIIAADKIHLIESLRERKERGTQDPEQALEKYVHLSIEMPSFLDTPSEVAGFVSRIADSSWDTELTATTRRDELIEVVKESARAYPDCIFRPLFSHDGSGLTPRAVKHRFNTFLAEFKPEANLRESDLKDWVLKAFWPDAWWRYLWNLRLGPEQCAGWEEKVEWIERLTKIGADLLNLIDILQSPNLSAAELGPTLDLLARKHAVTADAIDAHLAIYLAANPRWRRPPIGTQRIISQTISESSPGAESEGPSIPGVEGESQPGEAGLTPDNQILYAYWMAEKAESQGNDSETRQLLQAIVMLVRRREFSSRSAGTIGNAALIAERIDDPTIALELHLAAHTADPDHWNVAQNLVEFIIDARIERYYEQARLLLSQLQNEGRYHKPTRTNVLSLRLANLTGTPVPAAERTAAVESFLRQVAADPSVGTLTEIFSIGRGSLPQDVAVQAVRTVCEAITNDTERYRALRILADYLANDNDHRIEAIATDLYLYLLGTGLACLADETRVTQVKHNLATLLRSQDYDRAALLLWQDVYRLRAADESIRRSFAISLSELGHETEAASVLIGQELPPLDLEPEVLPNQFALEIDHWWERLDIHDHPPCPMPSFLQQVASQYFAGRRHGN